jgi:hypothetical protein
LLALCLFFGILRGPESSRALLVHFGSGSDTIDGEINQLLGLNQVYDLVCVRINILEDLLLALRLRSSILRMSAWMYDTVHVEVKVVDGGVVLFDFLRNCLFVLLFLQVVGGELKLCVFIEIDLVGVLGFICAELHFEELYIVFR